MTNPTITDKDRAEQVAVRPDAEANRLVTGIGVSGGVAIGQVVLLERVSTEIYPQRILLPEEVPAETRRFELAVQEAENQLKQIKALIKPGHPLEDHKYILDSHVMLLRDRMFFEGTKRSIAREMQNAEWALADTIAGISEAFDSIEDEYLRERARDVHSVGERVLRILMGRMDDGKIHQLPPNAIIVSHDLSPADTAQIQGRNVLGFAIDMGGRTSHTAIMARSLKLPAVTGLERLSREVQTGETIIIDGSTGAAIVNPDPETIFRYRERQEIYRNYHKNLLAFGSLPAVTSDGEFSTRILANIELMDEVQIAKEHGAEGIGLFRTEYLFLGRKDIPSEEEQFEAYKKILETNAPDPVTIRTLDVGADKFSPNLNLAHEANPAMGLRAIRLCLDRTDIFRTQLRAVLRASVHGSCRVLIPMISCLPELRATRSILEEEKEKLSMEGIEFDPEIKLGILVEVPSAAAIADLLAREADFFSIGTNDLIQYTLAIDRVNEHVNYLYDTLHPAVLRMIRQIATAGEAHGIPVAMCGEMAGDPVNAPILLGLGLNELSMNALSIPMVKKLIRSISIEECRDLTARAFEMTTAHEIRELLEDWIRQRFPQDYFISES